MSGWQELPFNEVISDESGGNIKTAQGEYLVDGKFAVIDQGKALIGGYVDDESRLCHAKLPTIVFGDHTRCLKYVDFPFCMGADGVKILRPKIDADVKYLFHYLRQLKIPNGGYDRHFKYLKRSRVVVPPIPDQRRIAEVLDRAEALRAKRRAALAKLDTLTQSIFLDMFGDPASNPMGWPTMPLKELLGDADVFVDGDWVESKDQDPNGTVRLIQLADIGDGFYVNKSSRFLTEATAKRLKCTTLQIGDVLIARMPDPLGRACLFPGDPKKAITVVDVCIIRPRVSGPNPAWLMNCINTGGFRGLIARQATGTTRERISRGNLGRLQIIVPPLILQQTFAHRAAAVEAVKTTQRAALSELGTLFASLQHRAFRGEL